MTAESESEVQPTANVPRKQEWAWWAFCPPEKRHSEFARRLAAAKNGSSSKERQ